MYKSSVASVFLYANLLNVGLGPRHSPITFRQYCGLTMIHLKKITPQLKPSYV